MCKVISVILHGLVSPEQKDLMYKPSTNTSKDPTAGDTEVTWAGPAHVLIESWSESAGNKCLLCGNSLQARNKPFVPVIAVIVLPLDFVPAA